METTLQLAQVVSQHGGPLSCLQTKITALINANLMVKPHHFCDIF